MAAVSDLEYHPTWPQQTRHSYPYSPSAASNASSTSSSAFSIDAPSSLTSATSSSAGWSSSRWQVESEGSCLSGHRLITRRDSQSSSEERSTVHIPSSHSSQTRSTVSTLPAVSRQNPRRTQRFASGQNQDGKPVNQCPRPPPSLIRQSERKDNFVDSLVDTATQMIETIWPLSVLNCGRDAALGAKQQNLIGLRTFVTEVLRRSKTSYSTLQVALYYLILIQASLPKYDFTMEQFEDSPACRAMQCGRRMFLAALILASKYLQDRNFSARAWSKISGLRTCEINTNEMAFLSAVNWKLHIPEAIFHRWTDVVLKHSPSANVNGPPRSSPSRRCWRSLIPLLTPELDNIDDISLTDSSYDSGYDSPGSDMSPPPIPLHEEMPSSPDSGEPTPKNPYTIPKALEPTLYEPALDAQILPSLPRLGPLPTPQLTPQHHTFCTPAVSASGICPRRASMSYAMNEVQKSELSRVTLDKLCEWKPRLPEPFPMSARRSSVSTSVSSISSPESMVSDRSSRPSRSSSISSVASTNCALPPPRLAVQATRRCANMQLCDLKEEQDGSRSFPQHSFARDDTAFKSSDWTCGNPSTESAGMNHSGQPVYAASTHEAASALRDLALNRPRISPLQTADSSPARSLKRSRTNSIDRSVECSVRGFLGQSRAESTSVLPDANSATTFLLDANNPHLPRTVDLNLKSTPPPSVDEFPRKRACAGSDRGSRTEIRLCERSVMVGGPGMWGGIL